MSLLVIPSTEYRQSFLEGAAEFMAEGRLDSTYALCLGYDLRGLQEHFDQFVRELEDLGDSQQQPGGRYLDRVLWLVDEGEYLGQASIRPELCTAYLLTYGGHIGYSVRPSKRRRGYGRELLALALEESRKMGLRKVLVTCDSDNVGSRKIIEYNGGVFESAMSMTPRAFRTEGRKPRAQVNKLRYWIDLSAKSLPQGPRPPSLAMA
jgi:predicted acetyltransferase